ncbi:MAG: GNAT family N-acetyltransferase [Polyangiaceae bacterium]|nr:GNAT family N-acetyltransferase [Polyangiaceae bacterium]
MRPAVVDDVDRLVGLNMAAHECHVSHHPEVFKSASRRDVSQWFHRLLHKSDARIWIAEQDSVPMAYVLAFLHERAENPFSVARRWCEIDQIAVEPRGRNQGVGRMLVQTVAAEARLRGIRELCARAWCFNDVAHQALTRLGFRPQVVQFALDLD